MLLKKNGILLNVILRTQTWPCTNILTVMSNSADLKIVSMNVRGIGNYKKCKQVYAYMKQNKVYIACLQETHGLLDNDQLCRTQWGM